MNKHICCRFQEVLVLGKPFSLLFWVLKRGTLYDPRKRRPRSVTDSAVTVRGRPFQGPKSVPRFGVRIFTQILEAVTKQKHLKMNEGQKQTPTETTTGILFSDKQASCDKCLDYVLVSP